MDTIQIAAKFGLRAAFASEFANANLARYGGELGLNVAF